MEHTEARRYLALGEYPRDTMGESVSPVESQPAIPRFVGVSLPLDTTVFRGCELAYEASLDRDRLPINVDHAHSITACGRRGTLPNRYTLGLTWGTVGHTLEATPTRGQAS
jgi:hypothetical protein